MKKNFLLLLASICWSNGFAQTDSEPCCAVISIDPLKSYVTVRDKTTGRLYQFKADEMDMRSIKKDDAVNFASNKVSAINGVKRTYAIVQLDEGAVCCAVVNVQLDEGAVCCAIVSIKNNSTGKNLTISVPRQIAATLKKDQSASFDNVNNLVILKSSYGGNGEMNAYGYPVESGEAKADKGVSTDRWIVMANNVKGSTGRIQFENPAGSIWSVYVYTMDGEKYVTSYAQSNNKGLIVLSPGDYKITINNVPVLNVPVQKGHDTKLKCGTLDIVSEVVWYLYDETGTTSYTSGNKPTKMPVPVGTYKLDLGGQSQIIVIKNGETVEM